MLAYVFWHWPSVEVDRQAYEASLQGFQTVLSENKPAGFYDAAVFRIKGAPWLPANTSGYEDWYIVQDSGALDLLNDAAVTPPRKDAHDVAARQAAGGTAGLYRLRQGQLTVGRARTAVWLAKPAGMSYADFFAALAPLTGQPDTGLWGRQMTLGPTTEFCLLSPEEIVLPGNLTGLNLRLESIWPLKKPPT